MPLTLKPNQAYTGTTHQSVWDNTYVGDNVLRVEGDIDAHTIRANNIYQMEEAIREIKERLLLVERDIAMENKYPELARARDEYIRVKGKYETLEIMKGER
jgi:hypothetical protein